jgi:DNA topoisomerase-1
MIEWTDMIKRFYNPFHEDVEETLEHSERATGERFLGTHPDSGKKIIARIGRFGPMIQIGDEQEDGEKPQFASLQKNQSIGSISLEDALNLFKLPREIGEHDGLPLKANIGRFGPYIQHGKVFVSIPKDEDPMTIAFARAVELLQSKLEEDSNKLVKSFPERDDVQILNGKWGVYLKIGKNNFKLPKDKDHTQLTLEECLSLAEGQSTNGRSKKSMKAKK